MLRRAIELGVTLIDTADAYGPEVNEQFIAETLHPYPEELVIGTKGGLTRPRPGAWENDGRPEYLRVACDGSLRRKISRTRPLSEDTCPTSHSLDGCRA